MKTSKFVSRGCFGEGKRQARLGMLGLTAALVLPLGLRAGVIEVPDGATYADIVTALGSAQSGDTVKLLGAKYTMTGELTLPAGVTLQGLGRDATVLQASGDSFRGVNVSDDNSILCDLTLKGYQKVKLGLGVYMTKGTVKNCRIFGNHGNVGGSQGLGVYMTGGNVINCVISNNYTHAENGDLFGAGIYMTGGWVEGCLVTGNFDNRHRISFGGVTPVYRGGGVHMTDGTLVNSTLSGNYAFAQAGGLYIDGSKARVINCIVCDNDCEHRRDAIGQEFAPASATNYCSHTIIGGGAAEQYPGIGGWAGLDANYKPTVYSSGVGTGDATVSFKSATDLDGNPRVAGGVTDLGCYAYTGDRAACGVAADRQFALVGATVTLTAIVHSATAPETYSWTITKPDSTTQSLTGAGPSLTLSQTGTYALSLTAGGKTTTRADWLVSAPLTNTVAAADSIADAVAVAPDGQVIALAKATYSITRPIRIRKDITVLGQGYADTIVKNTSKTVESGWNSFNVFRVFDIDSPKAVVDGVTARDGYAPDSRSNNESGIGIRIGFLGGTVRFCRVTGNTSAMSYSYGVGVGLFGSKARLTSTIVDGNVNNGSYGAGVYVNAGEVDSCLITDNTCKGTYGGNGAVYLASGTSGLVRNTTIVKNSASGSTGGGVYFAGTFSSARLVNCILIGNTSLSADTRGGQDWMMANGTDAAANATFSHCMFAETLTVYGTGSRSGSMDAFFADPANGDYHLKGMTCLDKGDEYDGIDTRVDLEGNPRMIGNAPDFGCYEAEEVQFIPSFSASPLKFFLDQSTVLTPDLYGAPEGTHVCRWIFERADGVAITNTSVGEATLQQSLSAGGIYDVTLQFFNNAQFEKATSSPFTNKGYLLSGARTNYVTSAVKTATPQVPFDSWDHASTNLNEIIDKYVLDGSVVLLDAGKHTLKKTVKITSGVTVRGAGREVTRLAPPSESRCVWLDHANAVVERLWVGNYTVGGAYNVWGATMFIDASGGTIRDCMVTNVTCKTLRARGVAIGCQSSNGVVSRCLIVNNSCSSKEYGAPSNPMWGMLAASAGMIDDCLVTGNHTTGYGVYVEGTAALWNCTIVNNEAYWTPWPDHIKTINGGGGLYLGSDDCRVYNCLVSGNLGESGTYAPNLFSSKTSQITGKTILRNCLFTFDDPTTTVGDKCLNADPLFKDAAAKNYHLSGNSPCRAKGVRGSWMTGALDFYGNPRVYGLRTHPDIGCEQQLPIGLLLLVR